MMARVEDDNNVTCAVLLYAYIIAREEEDVQAQGWGNLAMCLLASGTLE